MLICCDYTISSPVFQPFFRLPGSWENKTGKLWQKGNGRNLKQRLEEMKKQQYFVISACKKHKILYNVFRTE